MGNSIARVVENGNCSGCGACALLSDRVSMVYSDDGWMRPTIDPDSISREEERRHTSLFEQVCPGSRMRRQERGDRKDHETFGLHVSAWRAFAADPAVRDAGSSAGVLTALTQHIVTAGIASTVIGARSDIETPRRTVPVRITTREEALASSGSRYAPVSALSGYLDSSDRAALVGKPCEATAARRLHLESGKSEADLPILLSFFCAGTPSQRATDRLIEKLGVVPDDVTSLRYRGNGWPGHFVAESPSASGSVTYDDSWGKHLGRDLQWRCKICPDGTGEDSDVSVGDFWKADEKGYPLFDDAQGMSVAIARTDRGHALLLAAAAAGLIVLEPVDLDEVARIQPLQVNRRRTLAVRLAARLLAGKRIPRFEGYSLVLRSARHPRLAAKTFLGTLARSWRSR
ncbi:Coenzyme F420 hydrogenase/dehydrogenase, beta subunit C-terminal domain [Rathayibacter oskolensis]|uniref:Coenzyme F420 hydrogenase/dehydrogenase, beta subunit C-terminal domain n=1 Tax=Rathayibacter oskolensis TaxID=1891671 RepID=UPI001AD81A13|nr:Coenzyme F420 hydrogenase/dehydrogenase, beta subunit C-terminal domain [Rathayibacter oskolensis]